MILHVKNCSKFGYLRRKVVFLFGLSCWDLLNPWKIWNTLPWSWYHWKALKGAPSWFHNVLIMVEKLLNIEQFFTKFSLEWKLKKNLSALLILLENLLWIGFYEGNLEVLKPKVWESRIFCGKISSPNNQKKGLVNSTKGFLRFLKNNSPYLEKNKIRSHQI
jgi:hypothetical protein